MAASERVNLSWRLRAWVSWKEVLLQGARLVLGCYAGDRFFTTAKTSEETTRLASPPDWSWICLDRRAD